MSEFTDDPAETLMVLEGTSEQAVHWMSPLDANEALVLGFGEKTKFSHQNGTHVLLAAGNVRFVSATLPAATRRALISIAAGDTVGEF